MQNPKCCTLSSVCFRCFNDSVTATNVTVAATEKGPELRILSWPLGCTANMGCSGGLQSHFSPIHAAQDLNLPICSPQAEMCCRFLLGPAHCLSGKVWGQSSGGSSRSPEPVSHVPRFLGPVLMGHPHTKSRKNGNEATYAFDEHYV